MKFKNVMLALVVALAVSCGPAEKKDHKLQSIGLTVTIPGETTINEHDQTEYSSASTQFYVDGEGVEVSETDAESFPTDLKMLETAMTGAPEVKAITEKKTLPNGAFGVLFDNKNDDENNKDLLFYFKKGEKYFKITPIYNQGEKYAELVECIGTLK